jgi:hypothetical protein
MGYIMKRIINVLCIIIAIYSTFSFSQIQNPSNNSIITDLNQTISTTITGSENVSTWIDWNNSLIGYWDFNTKNATHIHDLSTRNNSGLISGDITSNNSDSIRGNYSTFDGSDDYISINNSIYNDLFIGGATISMWVKPQFTSSDLFYLASVGDLSSTNSWNFNLRDLGGNTNAIQLGYVFSGNYPTWIVNDVVFPDTWSHVTLVYDSSSGLNVPQFYINSILYDSFDSVLSPVGVPSQDLDFTHLSFGIREYDLARDYDGLMDEILIFNRTLSQQEVNALYQSQVHNFEFNTTNLLDNTQYNYTMFSINSSGDLLKQSYSFYTNSTYGQNIESTSLFPSQGILSILFSIVTLFIFLM